MLRKLMLAALVPLAAACTATPSTTSETLEGVVVRAGTSFGMCMGYCTTELRIAPDEVLFIESGRDPAANPERTRRAALRPGERDDLLPLAGPALSGGLQEVYGCPDCADGGAEWVEVERAGERRRVTFEYGSTVGPIQPLIAKTRELRERFPR
jgi:hypothetical protein